MKKTLYVVSFILAFILIFAVLQPVFIHKDDSGVSIRQFYNEPEDSLDVLIVGKSNVRTSVLPPVLWEEAGITSYNLSSNGMNTSAQYYLFRDALRFQSPKVVIIESDYLFEEVQFDSDSDEERYRQTLDNMPWSRVKLESVLDIVSKSEMQTFISYVFPLLRYHSKRSFDAIDFDRSYKNIRNLNMGAWEADDTTVFEQTPVTPFYVTNTAPATYDEYLVKIIDLCKDLKAEIILLSTPNCNEERLSIERHTALQDFAEQHGVTFIDLNNPELFHTSIGLNFANDFFDSDHVNIRGGRKVSRYLAHYLSETLNLQDYRNAPYDPHWDDVVDAHYERYELLNHTG